MVNMLASRMLGRGPDGAEADVPLKGVSVRVTIVDFMAEVELCQRYRNNGRSDGAAVEATYTFPLDSEGALTRCELSVDGRRVLAVVREKQEAKQSYDAAVAVGYAAALVEEDEAMPDVFSCAVGNIPAGAEAEVRITYITTLAADDTERRPRLRFTLPTAVAPRYFPAGSNGSNCGSNGGSSYGAVSGSGGYGETDYRLDVDVSARLASAITSMSSPTHPLTAEQCSAGDGVAVAATCFWRNLKLDGDLVLLLGCAEGHQPRAWLTAPLPDGSRAVAVALVPDLVGVDFDNESAGEFLFVLDRSGSMSGESIDAARQALIIALASLPLGATFNIVSFGSGFEKLFPAGSAAFNDESKAAATAVVAAMEADMGGTEILRPLKDIMDTPPDPARPRQVIVLTDGQVGNTRELVDFVREAHRRTGVRFFAAGVGSGVSHALVNGIARGGGGAAEFIADARGEAVQTKMMRLVGRALQPTITGAVVDYGSLPVSRTAPRRPPPIYAGTRTLLFGLLRPSEAASAAVFGGASVTVRMQGPDGEIVQMVRLMQPWDGDADADAGAVASRLLHACAVRVMLRDLEDDEEAENAGGAAGAHEGADSAKACKAAAVALSEAAGVKCRWTSFVAVEERVNVGGGDPICVPVPIDMGIAKMSAADFCGGGYGGGIARRSSSGGRGGGGMLMQCSAAPLSACPPPMPMTAACRGVASFSAGPCSSPPPPPPPGVTMRMAQTESVKKCKKMANGGSGGGAGLGAAFMGLLRGGSAGGGGQNAPPAARKRSAQADQGESLCAALPLPPQAPMMLMGAPPAAAAVVAAAPAPPAAASLNAFCSAEPCCDDEEMADADSGALFDDLAAEGGGHAADVKRMEKEKVAAVTSRSLTEILAVQRADGSWAAASPAVATWLALAPATTAAALAARRPAGDALLPSDDAWVTALVLAVLVSELAGQEELWRASGRKARRFLGKPDDLQLVAWLAAARA